MALRLASILPLLAILSTPALAQGGGRVITLPAPGSDEWQPLHFPKIERHTRYQVVEIEGRPVFRAHAECSASGMVLPLEGVDLRHTPRLAWSWKIERGLEIANERAKEGDDFAARVYVLFRFDAERASLWSRLQRRVASALYGEELPGKAINYVWSSRAEPGESWTNPYSQDAVMVARRSGEVGEWRSEVVDLVADHHRLLGDPLIPPLAVAVMSDADNSCGEATAYFADFRLTGP
jgi:hypothetical protein